MLNLHQTGRGVGARGPARRGHSHADTVYRAFRNSSFVVMPPVTPRS